MIESPDTLMKVLRSVLDEAPDSVLIHTPEGKLCYANVAACEEFGISPEDVPQFPLWGWTSAPIDVIQERTEILRAERRHTFISTTRKSSERLVEVHSSWVDTEAGPAIVSITRDVTERLEAEEALRRLAFRDPLTGLANRALLQDRLKHAIASAMRHGDVLGVLYIDIKDFKPINDTYGHDVGDRVLEILAQRMSGAVRAEDTVARVGGDEFVVVLPRLSKPSNIEKAARKLSAVIGEPIPILNGLVYKIEATIGHALFDPEADDAHSILIRADLAMYTARRNGEAIAEAPPLD